MWLRNRTSRADVFSGIDEARRAGGTGYRGEGQKGDVIPAVTNDEARDAVIKCGAYP